MCMQVCWSLRNQWEIVMKCERLKSSVSLPHEWFPFKQYGCKFTSFGELGKRCLSQLDQKKGAGCEEWHWTHLDLKTSEPDLSGNCWTASKKQCSSGAGRSHLLEQIADALSGVFDNSCWNHGECGGRYLGDVNFRKVHFFEEKPRFSMRLDFLHPSRIQRCHLSSKTNTFLYWGGRLLPGIFQAKICFWRVQGQSSNPNFAGQFSEIHQVIGLTWLERIRGFGLVHMALNPQILAPFSTEVGSVDEKKTPGFRAWNLMKEDIPEVVSSPLEVKLGKVKASSQGHRNGSLGGGFKHLSPTALAMGSLPIWAPGRLRGAGSGRFREGFGAGFREGSGAGSERQVPGRFRSRFRITGSGKVPGQVPNHGFREGSGAGSERQVPGRFRVSFSNQEGSGAGSESRVPGRFRGRFRTTGSGKVPEHGSESRVPGRFRGRFRTTGSGKVPGQVPNHGFREGSGAGSERQVPGRFRVSFSNHGFQEGSGAGSEPRVPRRFWGRFRTTGSGKVPGQFFEPRSEPRVPGRFRGRFRLTSSWKSTVYVWIFNIYIFFSPTALAMGSLPI